MNAAARQEHLRGCWIQKLFLNAQRTGLIWIFVTNIQQIHLEFRNTDEMGKHEWLGCNKKMCNQNKKKSVHVRVFFHVKHKTLHHFPYDFSEGELIQSWYVEIPRLTYLPDGVDTFAALHCSAPLENWKVKMLKGTFWISFSPTTFSCLFLWANIAS